ncbi:integrin alpha [Halobaculum litoreum]|uniref:integrin alpha n=1 Tax=Halobaculum litoreum TaxID=3031998 RepID=UPI0024C44C5A|nr:integrin alpha [Halobaculum sp. DT92]
MGAPRRDTVAGNDSGAAYLIDGEVRRGSTVLDDADATLRGETPRDEAGTAVADAGDVSGDDAADVAVGAPRAADGGIAYVLRGDCVDDPAERDDDRDEDRDKDRDKDRDDDRDKDRDDDDEDDDLTRASIAVTCRDDGGRLVVTNPNDEPVRVVVTGPGGFERRTTLDAEGGDDALRLSALPDGDYRVRTLTAGEGDGETVGRDTLTVECADDGGETPPLGSSGRTRPARPRGGR